MPTIPLNMTLNYFKEHHKAKISIYRRITIKAK